MTDIPNPSGTTIPSADSGYDLLGVLSLPHRWGDVLAKGKAIPERTMRDMLREIGCAAPYGILRALVCEGEHRLVGRVADPGPEGKKGDKSRWLKSEKVREFHQGWADALPQGRKLRNLTHAAMEMVPFGHKLAQVEWDPITLVPLDIAPKPRLNYTFEKDESNRITAVLVKGSQDTKLPPANVVAWTFGGSDYAPEGEGVLVSCFPAYYSKGLTRIREDRAVDQAGGGVGVITQSYPPAGTPSKPAMIEVGTGVDKKLVPRTTVLASEIKRTRSNDWAVLGEGDDAKFLSVDSHELFGSVFERNDREMTLAFLHVARATIEAQHGSKADSGTAEGFVQTFRDALRALVCDPINGLIDLVTVLHFGPEWLEFSPRYEITTEEQTDLEPIAKVLQGNLENFTLDQINHMASSVGLPLWDEKPEAPEPAPVVPAVDPNAPPAEFKLTSDGVNESAQRSLSSSVKKHDKQLRALVTKLKAGEITRDDFVGDFGEILRAGHDEAFRLGWRHGGGGRTISEDAEAYLAETVSVQGSYASNLADELADGTASEDAGLARARQYARRMRGSANRGFIESADPDEEFDWVLGGNENHCETCPEYAAISPFTKDTAFASPGEDVDAAGVKTTDCGSACKCKWVRKDGREGFGPVEFD